MATIGKRDKELARKAKAQQKRQRKEQRRREAQEGKDNDQSKLEGRENNVGITD